MATARARDARAASGRRLVLALTAALAAAYATWPAMAPPRAAAQRQTIAVTAREFEFEPGTLTAPAGEVTFEVTNDGAIEHNFVIEDAQRRALASIAVISPGASEPLTTTLAPGSYTFVCTLPGHREAGMVGTLTAR